MANEFKRKHISVDQFVQLKPYKRPSRSMGTKDYGRETEQHAENLKREAAQAWTSADSLIASRDADFSGNPGRYLEFETADDGPPPDLSWKTKGIRLANVDTTHNGVTQGVIFVPDNAQEFFETKLDEYKEGRTGKGRPSHEARFASIEHFRAARLESLWKDRRPLPDEGANAWWECWCWPDRVGNFEAKVASANALLGEGRLKFSERIVLFVWTNRTIMARIAASCDAIAELRLGRDDAYFFTSDAGREDQGNWIESAVDRITYGENYDLTAVCLLDTGVNRGHALLAPAFAENDLHAVIPDWRVEDHHGHGTELSGLALYGDLTARLQSADPITLTFVGESVKLLPPDGFPENEPQSYGLITQQAMLRPEIAKPNRERIFCMAITQSEVFGPRATSWSASLDNAAFGGDNFQHRRRRLICVSAGNLPDGLKHADLEDWDSYEVEDPAHAWNILTVGGYTQKGPITDHGFQHWNCAADIGKLSPYSRVSATWKRGVSPIKPELVLEAGNKGIDPSDTSMASGIDSLSLLTTSRDPIVRPLTLSWATSAATAQLAGMAAEILADDPALWPETIRALLIHSAQWTLPMEAELLGTHQKTERIKMLRRFGYGVPRVDRALRSASNALALVAQQEIQPFIKRPGKDPQLNQAHFYDLPWPTQALLELGEAQVRLRVTLSYFVEPNPSADSPLSAARYRSAGLRFDLRRRNEEQNRFEARVNALAAVEEEANAAADPDPDRLFGVNSISAGSVHVEEWRCSAANLADRNGVAIFPVGGWWKTIRKDNERNNGKMRYALIITIDAGDVEADLWAEVNIAANVEVAPEIEI